MEDFSYLGRTIAYNISNWTAVHLNLRKYRRQWVMIARVLESTGTIVRDQGAMYKAVAQLVILYGSESWVVTGEMLKILPAFHHRAAQRITGMTAKCATGG